jgi:hypothetical protein
MDPKRSLTVDWGDLEVAFESRDHEEMGYYLDLVTGKVEMLTKEFRVDLNQIYEEYADEETGGVSWDTAFQALGTPDWQQEVILLMDAIDNGLGKRYLEVPNMPSHESYRDMEDFIETLRSANIQRQLNAAINGRGPFRNFKNVLLNYPREREMWFKYQSERMRYRIREWLEDEGIEPENPT